MDSGREGLIFSLSDDDISKLVRLGFSPNQAKVYLALVILGASTAKSVGKLSGVSREEVYRKLNELQKLRVVMRIFTTPSMFRAVPLECVTNTMLKRKAHELSELQAETEELLRNFNQYNKRENVQEDKSEIIFVPERRPILERAEKELRGLKIGLDTICSWKKGVGWLSHHHDLFMNAVNRKVKIRFILERPEEAKFPKIVKELQSNPLFQTKSIQAIPPACLGIYDQKTLLLDTSSTTSFVESPVIWSNNPSIVRMAQIYFETIWTNSLK
jgi:sugar-specific transcriptional regulator TrmB